MKCPYYWRRDGSGRVHKDVPAHYWQQMNVCMECTNREWCDFVSYDAQFKDIAIYRVLRDQSTFEKLLPHYKTFHNAMDADLEKPPPLGRAKKQEIKSLIADSMRLTVHTSFWDSVLFMHPNVHRVNHWWHSCGPSLLCRDDDNKPIVRSPYFSDSNVDDKIQGGEAKQRDISVV